MAIGPSVKIVAIAGNYIDFEGNPIQGQVRFTLGDVLRNGTDDQLVAPSSIVVPLSAGAFTVELPATNDPDLVPNPFVYTVEESFPGGRTYTISVPYDTVGTLDLADLSPTPTITTNFTQMVDQTTFNQLVANIATLDSVIDQDIDAFIASGKYWYVKAEFATYSAVASAFATYSALASATYEITGSDIQPFITSAESYASQASANASLATTTATDTISPLLLIGG